MKKEEIEVLLLEARAYRDMRNYAGALEDLHQIVNAVTDNVVYTYLLASTYLEAENTEAARLYADKAITIQANYKEAIELLGLINEAEEKFEAAEGCYLKCLEIDPNFDNARFLLVQLYSNYFFPKRLGEYQDGYIEFFNVPEKVAKHATYLLEKNIVDLDKLTKKKTRELSKFCLLTFRLLSVALYKLRKYEDCIQCLKKQIEFSSLHTKLFPGFFINEETNIFKLYHLLGNEEKKKEYIKIFESYMNQGGNKKESEEHVLNSIAEADKGLVYL
ncbi:tetratricopeptide repeat protein [Pedobacter sp. WC2423]|uniref:tetratricopeptide repeat protein n=1 Tax=Pedobacter sp. WC2423 TaxID=3234142 RepID=UPI003466212B